MSRNPFETLGNSKYPWETWTTGEYFAIADGEDFHVVLDNMRVQLHQKARKLEDRKVVTKVFDGRLMFRFITPEDWEFHPLAGLLECYARGDGWAVEHIAIRGGEMHLTRCAETVRQMCPAEFERLGLSRLLW